MRKAAEAASELAAVIDDKKLYTTIGGEEAHPHRGVDAPRVDARRVPVRGVVAGDRARARGGWEARVEVRTRDGQVIGAAEAECMRDEKRWATADDYAVRSMAQTRAASKALKMPLGFVFAMAGYETTPAEEMPSVVEQPPRPKPAGKDPTLVEERQTAEIFRLLEELDELDPATDWAAWCREYAGVPFHKIDKIGADRVIVGLMEKVHDLSPPSEEE